MTEVRITGASDDLIEIEGALVEEFPASSGMAHVYLSTGDAIRFRFEAEGWRAAIVHDATAPTVRRTADDDVVTVAGPVAWLVVTEDGPLLPRRVPA